MTRSGFLKRASSSGAGIHQHYADKLSIKELQISSQQLNHQLAKVDLDPRHTLHGCNLLDNVGAYCPDVEGCRCSWTTITTSLAVVPLFVWSPRDTKQCGRSRGL